MSNELLLIVSLVLIYTCVVLFYRFLGKSGLYCWTVLATIAANIEVLIVVDAFGMEQTLGNILFASTFLVTDILSETEGKRAANKAVLIGILTSGVFVLISQSWLLYTPNASGWAWMRITAISASSGCWERRGLTCRARRPRSCTKRKIWAWWSWPRCPLASRSR